MTILWEVALRLCKYTVNHKLSIYSSTYLCRNELTDSYFIQCIFDLSLFIIIIYSGTRLSSWLLCSCDMFHHSLKTASFSGTKSCFFYFFYSVSESAILLSNPGFF